MLAEYRRRRDFVVEACADRWRHHSHAERRVLCVPEYQRRVSRRACIRIHWIFPSELLARQHVAVVPGEAFGTRNHVRISYATSMTELERGLDRLDKFIGSVRT